MKTETRSSGTGGSAAGGFKPFVAEDVTAPEFTPRAVVPGLLENNIVQTIGSAGESVAAGVEGIET